MANTVIGRQMMFSDEDAQVQRKKPIAIGKPKCSVFGLKKTGSRKALGDITNKSDIRPKASSKKHIAVEKKEIDVAKEGFLHDHSKCIKSQQLWDDHYLILLKNDPGSSKLRCSTEKMEWETNLLYEEPEKMESPKLSMSDWPKSPSPWGSPEGGNDYPFMPLSPMPSWSLVDSVEFKLKPN